MKNYLLAADEAEQIAVDGVAKALDPDAKISGLSQAMMASLNAVGILRQKIRFLINSVKNEPKVRENHDFMRRLN